MQRVLNQFSWCLCAFVVLAQVSPSVPLAPTNLRCEYLFDAIGIDVEQPRFSWMLEHPERGQKQSAYQIVVSSRPALQVGDQWDSGRVESDQSVHVAYEGKPLKSGQTYFWKVRYWDNNGSASPYSRPARFEMGLLSRTEWKGEWIGGRGQLRKEFTLAGRPLRARAYVATRGWSELRINGKKGGRHVLDPGWTAYDKRILYSTYDVTPQLRSGRNAAGILLGRGWSAPEFYPAGSAPQPNAVLLQLNIELDSGERVSVASDTSWKSAQGPIVSDSIYDGEVYDARLESPGWDDADFDDSHWKQAQQFEAPPGALSAQMIPAIQVVDTVIPAKVGSPQAGVYVYDMGQNFSGWVQLRVRGSRGTAVQLRFAELVYDDGMINTENLRRAKATDVYILRGEGEEVYEPRFTYHGFRYVEMTGFPGTPKPDTIRGRVVHTAVKTAGGFYCSKSLLNQLSHTIFWGQKTNLHSIPTDCPQRDERMGWLGDAHLSAETAMFYFDMGAFYTNFLRNIRDNQGPDGSVSDTVPLSRYGNRPADPAWGSAFPLLCWYAYQHYGDRRLLEENYAGLTRWLDCLRTRSQDGVLAYSHYGDWVALEKTPGNLVSTFYYAYNAQLLAQIAEVLGKRPDAQNYRRLAAEIAEGFHRKYFDPQSAVYGGGTQTANALALFLNLVPEDRRGAVASNLFNDIVYAKNTSLTTGIHGTKYLMELLTRLNRVDLAYELATKSSYPSWGYMIEKGATTIWELWQAKSGPAMNSHNHPAFGSVGAWLFQVIAGINADSRGPGYSRVRIQPHVAGDLRWASASVETLRGVVSCSWSREVSRLKLEVAIPVGSQAEVHVPKLGMANVIVKEGDRVVWEKGNYQAGAPGVSGAWQDSRAVVFEIGSGRYVFEARDER